jgi:steroid delta-isomerase-like uncharacterized protein
MTEMTPKATLQAYFEAFNAGDIDGMVACLTEDVEHHVNQGGVRRGREAFRAFSEHMARCYSERLVNLVTMLSEDGSRGAAEFTVRGAYLATDAGLPEARGQTYTLPAGTFFAFRDGRIARVTNCYNLKDWIAQVSR